jgi:hypothetical protein
MTSTEVISKVIPKRMAAIGTAMTYIMQAELPPAQKAWMLIACAGIAAASFTIEEALKPAKKEKADVKAAAV